MIGMLHAQLSPCKLLQIVDECCACCAAGSKYAVALPVMQAAFPQKGCWLCTHTAREGEDNPGHKQALAGRAQKIKHICTSAWVATFIP